MAEFTIPPVAYQIQCLVVTSPLGRSGTTLMQRLLNSSQDVLIYGHNQADLLYKMSNTVVEYQQHMLAQADNNQAKLARIVEGRGDFWQGDILPAIPEYVALWAQFFYQVLSYQQAHAKSLNRRLWGIQQPGMNPTAIEHLARLLPKLKFIFIYRNIYDVIASLKSLLPNPKQFDLTLACQSWTKNMEFLHADLAGSEQCYCLAYEELIAQRKQKLHELETFIGINDIDPAVLNLKINTWVGNQFDSQSKPQYLPPCQLSAADRQVITQLTRPTMQRYYPGYCG